MLYTNFASALRTNIFLTLTTRANPPHFHHKIFKVNKCLPHAGPRCPLDAENKRCWNLEHRSCVWLYLRLRVLCVCKELRAGFHSAAHPHWEVPSTNTRCVFNNYCSLPYMILLYYCRVYLQNIKSLNI